MLPLGMDLKQFLDENPMISRSDLARAMYPEVPKSAKSKLINKLNEAKAGSGKQRILPDDIERAKTALKQLGVNISTFVDPAE